MARVGVHGKIPQGGRYTEAVPFLEWVLDQIENTLNGQIDSTNLADYAAGVTSGVTTSKINDGAVTAAKLSALSVTSAAVDSSIAKIATGQYTGDGTQNRIIAVGFRGRFVVVVNHTTRALFIAFGGTGGPFVRLQIDNAGNITDGATDFTGCTSTGFTLGSAAGGGNSNTNAVTYSYLALG